MIHSIEINDFRQFKNVKFNLGKYITVIGGKNALGKSTLLGLLGNSCELKPRQGKPLIHKQFRTEFGEIFKASEKFDPSGSNKCKINFSNINDPDKIIDYKSCRVTWQKIKPNSTKKRFRCIPTSIIDNRKSEKKYVCPSLYLGLSRLYPIGESKDENLSIKDISLSDKEKSWFEENYKIILNIFDNNTCKINYIDIYGIDRKKGIGISTDCYDCLTNSAGQDNVGQILLAILSFQRLKSNLGKDYHGGVLLIDELDATLHPYAQKKLVSLLIQMGRKFNLQTVFTTHSLSILEDLCKKSKHNSNNKLNEIQLIYLTNSNGMLEIKENPSYTYIYNDLNICSIIQNTKKITVYSEDPETRWFIKNILKDYLYRLELIDIRLGCKQLISLNKQDPEYFSTVLFILDGDVEKSLIQNMKNILTLPGCQNPENELFNFLINLDSSHEFWRKCSELDSGITKEYLHAHGPNSSYYNKYEKDREKCKEWFNDHIEHLDRLNIFKYWENEQKEVFDQFRLQFIKAFNLIIDKIGGTKINVNYNYI